MVPEPTGAEVQPTPITGNGVRTHVTAETDFASDCKGIEGVDVLDLLGVRAGPETALVPIIPISTPSNPSSGTSKQTNC